MNERKRKILIPQYMHSFRCIGPACEDSCCVGWRVDIDHETYTKYQKIRDEELTDLIDKNINRNRSTPSEASYAKVKLNAEGACPFLDESKLCKIQCKRGEEYLSNVCTTYPRISNRINGVLEKSATMSCPEAVRLALLNPDGIEFDETEESVETRNLSKNNIDTHDRSLIYKPNKYIWELRIFTISVLQNREYALSERLIILGMFFQKLNDYIKEKKINDIPNLIASYTNFTADGSFKESLVAIPSQQTIQMELLKEICDVRFTDGIQSKRYLECYTEFLAGILYTSDAKVEEIGERYRQGHDEYYSPFMKEHEYILENYLVNYVFKNLFPFSGEKTVFDDYIVMILHYALIKLHLIGISAFHKGLDTDKVVKLIQSFAKTVEHNRNFIGKIHELLVKNNFTTMAYMAILIKN